MFGQLWVLEELPEEGAVAAEGGAVEGLAPDALDAALLGVVVVLAVAAEIPRPRLSPRALAAIPAARKGRLSFMMVSSCRRSP
jgi:hypothetical protein